MNAEIGEKRAVVGFYDAGPAAAHLSLEDIRKQIGANSLHYLSYEELIAATGLPQDVFCTSCFTGDYPIDIGMKREGIIFGV